MDPISLEHALLVYMDSASKGSPTPMSDDILSTFGEECRQALYKSFVKDAEASKTFTLRGSNIGKPVCQLQRERDGVPQESPEYNSVSRMLFGNIAEAYVMAILRGAGIDFYGSQEKIKINVGGDNFITGTPDVIIGDYLYDIKSTTEAGFNNKFGMFGGVQALLDGDSFGYVEQLYSYAKALNKKVGGWIVINKNSGAITVCPAHNSQDIYDKVDAKIQVTYAAMQELKEHVKCFEPEEEVVRGKPTGNLKLHNTCRWCPFKHSCWPSLQILPSVTSSAKTPNTVYYVHLTEEWQNKSDARHNYSEE